MTNHAIRELFDLHRLTHYPQPGTCTCARCSLYWLRRCFSRRWQRRSFSSSPSFAASADRSAACSNSIFRMITKRILEFSMSIQFRFISELESIQVSNSIFSDPSFPSARGRRGPCGHALGSGGRQRMHGLHGRRCPWGCRRGCVLGHVSIYVPVVGSVHPHICQVCVRVCVCPCVRSSM